MHTFLDVSTIARWSGPAVGIVRVERELARYAFDVLEQQIRFCVYDLVSESFLELKRSVVGDILEKKLRLNFSPSSNAIIQATTFKRRIRNKLIGMPLAYQAVQRARGHRLTLAQIEAIRDHERRTVETKLASATIPLTMAVRGAVPLSPETTIISGGLDWEFKKIRAIRASKRISGFRYFVVIYDLIGVHRPHFVVPGYVDLLAEYFGELAWTVDAGLCISETTRREFENYCTDFRIKTVRTASFELGSDVAAFESEPAELPSVLQGKSFALYVSTIEPRKNHRRLYEAWCHAIETNRIDPSRHALVFVGREGWETDNLLGEIRRNPATRESIVVLSSIPDATLNRLYADCAFTLLPSYYEGYGLPLAEALAQGKVCVTSGAGALREIGEGLRIDIDPYDTVSWSNEISRLFANPDAVRDLEKRIRASYRPVTWTRAAQRFFEIARGIQVA